MPSDYHYTAEASAGQDIDGMSVQTCPSVARSGQTGYDLERYRHRSREGRGIWQPCLARLKDAVPASRRYARMSADPLGSCNSPGSHEEHIPRWMCSLTLTRAM